MKQKEINKIDKKEINEIKKFLCKMVLIPILLIFYFSYSPLKVLLDNIFNKILSNNLLNIFLSKIKFIFDNNGRNNLSANDLLLVFLLIIISMLLTPITCLFFRKIIETFNLKEWNENNKFIENLPSEKNEGLRGEIKINFPKKLSFIIIFIAIIFIYYLITKDL